MDRDWLRVAVYTFALAFGIVFWVGVIRLAEWLANV